MKKIISKLETWSKDIRFYFVIVSLGLLSLSMKYTNLKSNYIETVEENYYQKAIIDSLSSEIFVRELEASSYNIMWGILEEVNQPLADSINNLVE